MYEQSLLDPLPDMLEGAAGADSAGATNASASGSSGEQAVAGGAGRVLGGGTGGALDDETTSAGSSGDTGEGGGSGGAQGGTGGSAASGGIAGANGGVGGASAGSPGVAGSVGNAGTAGAGGSAGAPATPLCTAYPLTARATWIPSASSQSTTPKNPPSALTDGLSARWSSGKPQSGDEWLQVDFGAVVSLRGINLQQGPDTNDFPRSYAVIISDTAKDLTGTVRASGLGTTGASTNITLPKPFSGRYLLVKQTGSSLSWWSVAEVEVSCAD